jgi:pilus assembly protein CpaB
VNKKVFIMVILAASFGVISYIAGTRWLENQAQARMSEIESQRNDEPVIELASVVVAAEDIVFGEQLVAEKLKLVPWPKTALPDGAFQSIEVLTGDKARKALKALAPNEPVLASKISGENGNAGLAGTITTGMRAVTIPVDLVNGVGGFVMPGDRVDIVLTRKSQQDGEQTAGIIMENVKVLSIDQDMTREFDGSKVAKTVTLETDTNGAQRLALANSAGRLSLLLRGSGDDNSVQSTILSIEDLDGRNNKDKPSEKGLFSFLKEEEKKTINISVVRGEEIKNHAVPTQESLKTVKRE